MSAEILHRYRDRTQDRSETEAEHIHPRVPRCTHTLAAYALERHDHMHGVDKLCANGTEYSRRGRAEGWIRRRLHECQRRRYESYTIWSSERVQRRGRIWCPARARKQMATPAKPANSQREPGAANAWSDWGREGRRPEEGTDRLSEEQWGKRPEHGVRKPTWNEGKRGTSSSLVAREPKEGEVRANFVVQKARTRATRRIRGMGIWEKSGAGGRAGEAGGSAKIERSITAERVAVAPYGPDTGAKDEANAADMPGRKHRFGPVKCGFECVWCTGRVMRPEERWEQRRREAGREEAREANKYGPPRARTTKGNQAPAQRAGVRMGAHALRIAAAFGCHHTTKVGQRPSRDTSEPRISLEGQLLEAVMPGIGHHIGLMQSPANIGILQNKEALSKKRHMMMIFEDLGQASWHFVLCAKVALGRKLGGSWSVVGHFVAPSMCKITVDAQRAAALIFLLKYDDPGAGTPNDTAKQTPNRSLNSLNTPGTALPISHESSTELSKAVMVKCVRPENVCLDTESNSRTRTKAVGTWVPSGISTSGRVRAKCHLGTQKNVP
ncbi:hypothetical protein FB45DRAFT_1009656 [Roridomyces roridus]|uniref:Uncharacterized protein n=1 Tax=Roridomyces roridus TaxID=1738132 RepID=A0AAD7B5B4_9AGAR|nr:hypothetical protein FB45DRAFT_1009656 [Roridomyces roridus]